MKLWSQEGSGEQNPSFHLSIEETERSTVGSMLPSLWSTDWVPISILGKKKPGANTAYSHYMGTRSPLSGSLLNSSTSFKTPPRCHRLEHSCPLPASASYLHALGNAYPAVIPWVPGPLRQSLYEAESAAWCLTGLGTTF